MSTPPPSYHHHNSRYEVEDGYTNDGLNYYHEHDTSHNHAESGGESSNFSHQNQYQSSSPMKQQQQQQYNHQEEYFYPQQQYFPPSSPYSYQIRHSTSSNSQQSTESFFTFINRYEKDEAREAEEKEAKEKSESDDSDKNQLNSSTLETKDDISILLRIYSRRFTPECVGCIVSFLPISVSSLISKSYQSVFDGTHYKSLYQFGYNHYYSKQSEHIYKRVNATWKETLLEMYKMQFREKEQILSSKFPHPSVNLTQNFMGFVNSEDLINFKFKNNFENRKLRFTMITYEKYNTSDMFKLFNKNNQNKILLDDNQTVEYEMNYVGYLLPGSHDFSNFESADAIILTYSVIDFHLFYTLSSWINLLETIAPDVPVILLGTHANYRKDSNIMTKLRKKERYVMRFMECVELAKKFNILSYLEMDACNYVGYEKEISSCGSEEEDKHHNHTLQSNQSDNVTTEESLPSQPSTNTESQVSYEEDDVPIETIIDISSEQVLSPFIELPDNISKQIHQTLIASSKAAIHFAHVNNEVSIRNFWKGTASFYTECLPSRKCSIQ